MSFYLCHLKIPMLAFILKDILGIFRKNYKITSFRNFVKLVMSDLLFKWLFNEEVGKHFILEFFLNPVQFSLKWKLVGQTLIPDWNSVCFDADFGLESSLRPPRSRADSYDSGGFLLADSTNHVIILWSDINLAESHFVLTPFSPPE